MFIRKRVVVFFILQMIVSSFCGTVKVDVDPESEGSGYMNSDEFLDYSGETDLSTFELIELILSPFFIFVKGIFNSAPELFNSNNNVEDHLDTNFHKKMALIGLKNNSNEDSENNFEEYSKRYRTSYWDSYSSENSEAKIDKTPENNFISDSEKNSEKICPGEDHSLINHNDIKYLIEEKAEIFKIKENILNSYYTDAAEVLKKNIDNIQEFKKRFKERPGHMLHVLDSITSWRKEQEPSVEEIAAQLEQFPNLEDNFKDVAKGSAVTLNQLERYKKICEINCEEISIENRFGHEIVNNSLIVSNRTGMYCIRLKDLNDYINEKLSGIRAQHGEGLNQGLEVRDKMYEQHISELKNSLKEAAVKQFGMTMYDILSLQDDYNHFMKDLEHVNISSEIHNIIENTAEIGFMRLGLKRDLEKYRQYCMKCGNQRVKRDVFDYYEGSSLEGVEELSVIPIKKIKDAETGASFSVEAAVEVLIQAKIDEIREGIANDITTMFAELDKIFNDPNVIDIYVSELDTTLNDIEEGIKTEQEAFHRLRSRVPKESIDKIIVLSKESKQLVHNLESTKLFIDQFIQKF